MCPRDFLDEIDLASHVIAAEAWHPHLEGPIGLAHDVESQRGQQLAHKIRLEGDAQEMLDAREPEVYRGCLESNGATVQDRPVDLSTRGRHNQRHCTRHR